MQPPVSAHSDGGSVTVPVTVAVTVTTAAADSESDTRHTHSESASAHRIRMTNRICHRLTQMCTAVKKRVYIDSHWCSGLRSHFD